MPFEIVKTGQGKGLVVNTQSGRQYSKSPIPLANAEKQLRLISSEKYDDWRGRGLEHSSSHVDMPKESSDPSKETFIQEVVESPKFKKGAFTAQAKKKGMEPKEMMKEVLENPEKYDVTTRRRAQFMKNIQKKE